MRPGSGRKHYNPAPFLKPAWYTARHQHPYNGSYRGWEAQKWLPDSPRYPLGCIWHADTTTESRNSNTTSPSREAFLPLFSPDPQAQKISVKTIGRCLFIMCIWNLVLFGKSKVKNMCSAFLPKSLKSSRSISGRLESGILRPVVLSTGRKASDPIIKENWAFAAIS